MRTKRLWLQTFLTGVLIFSLLLGIFSFENNPAQARTIDDGAMPTIAYTNKEGEQVVVPDFTTLTFGKLPPIEEAGWISISKDLVKRLGYDPSRVWGELANVADVVKLGDIEDALGVGKFSLDAIANITHLDLEKVALSAVKEIIGQQTIGDLVKAIPDLGGLDVGQVKPIADLLGQLGSGGDWNEKIGTLVQNEALAKLPIGKYLDLSKYGIDSIPGLLNSPLESFKAWGQSSITGVLGDLGLASVPLASFPIPLLNGAIKVGKVDLVWGATEHGDSKVPPELFISGAVKDKSDRTTPVPCSAGKPCPYIELTDSINLIKANDKVTDSFKSLHGKRWVVGGSKGMKVKEGYGPLKKLNGGWGAAGITVFGADFGKIALTSTDESTGRAKFSLYLRACAKIPFVGKSCSPYFIGPIPFPLLNTKEKGFVLVASTGKPKVNIPSKYADQVGQIQQQYEPQPISVDGSSGTLCSTGSGEVDFKALADGISSIEGDYSSRGVWGCDRDGNCGRGLGRYQLMTYRSDVKESIEKQPGGKAFYSRISSGYNPSAAELTQYFPAASQDALFVAAQKENINKLTKKGISGDGLIACLGQMWYSGKCTNSSGRDYIGGPTISQYGQILVRNYRKALEKLGSKAGTTCALASTGGAGDGKTTGKFINPTPGAPMTSDFGHRHSPCKGCSDFHKGIDLGVANGTKVKAADGGTVIYAGTAKGYGNVLIIDHGNGLQTRYAHLESFTVPKGTKVSQGQIVAKADSTGVGTGAHLHFEVRENSSVNKAPFDPSLRAVNPEKYVKF